MILMMEQFKWLEKKGDDSRQYHFIGQEKATAAERDELKAIDNDFFEIYGFHMIDNYKEI